jgi:hypothetical protein
MGVNYILLDLRKNEPPKHLFERGSSKPLNTRIAKLIQAGGLSA